MSFSQTTISTKPSWLKVPVPSGGEYAKIKERRKKLGLATVCEEARCPNIGECWSSGTATFMLMGAVCTRGCRFCSIDTKKYPDPLDPLEPLKISEALKAMQLRYAVLTTVDRDDLPDQGAEHIQRCIQAIRAACIGMRIEILMPDFRGETALIDKIIASSPDVIAHNVETVKRLTPEVRDRRAGYEQSLFVLRYIKGQKPEQYTKTSLMVGLGETEDEVINAMHDIKDTGAEFLTLGQYLRPTKRNLKVREFIHPGTFKKYEEEGLKMGFLHVASGPLVRSSYKASEQFIEGVLSK